MASGYDKFFKEAKKASQRPAGAPKKAGSKARVASEPAGSRFQLKANKDLDPGMGRTPEERLRLELARRMKEKKRQRARTKAKFPVMSAVCATAALVFCAIGYFNADEAEDMMTSAWTTINSHVEIGFLGSANAAGKESQKAAQKKGDASNGNRQPDSAKGDAPAGDNAAKSAGSGAGEKEKPAEASGQAKAHEIPNIKNWSPEELSFFSKLNERKRELDLKEAELAKLEEELQKRKTELDDRLKQLETMRAEISKTLKSRVANDQEKVDKLVQFYSNMKPQQAAKVVESLNEDLAVEILDKMKKKNAAEILNMMNAKKARKLSEMMTGYERSVASESSRASENPESQDEATDESEGKAKKQ